jgi:putative two-component system response regulator
VLDAWDAMLHGRPYQRPKTPAQALAELRRERGRQFDPAWVDGVVAVLGGG